MFATLNTMYHKYRHFMRRSLYDLMISSYTVKLYEQFFQKCQPGERILDIGVGNGYAMMQCRDVIVQKGLHIHGIDICQDSLDQCSTSILAAGLADNVSCGLPDTLRDDTPKYDMVFLSNSYSVITDIEKVMNNAFRWSKNEDNVWISLTLFDKPSRVWSCVKPRLGKLLGFEFGRYITHSMLNQELTEMGVAIVHKEHALTTSFYGVSIAHLYNLRLTRTKVVSSSSNSVETQTD